MYLKCYYIDMIPLVHSGVNLMGRSRTLKSYAMLAAWSIIEHGVQWNYVDYS